MTIIVDTYAITTLQDRSPNGRSTGLVDESSLFALSGKYMCYLGEITIVGNQDNGLM
jgi:hypothetical protein